MAERDDIRSAIATLKESCGTAPADAPIQNEDQSHCSPGLKGCPRSMPAWRREFHQEISNEQRLLESMGAWCG